MPCLAGRGVSRVNGTAAAAARVECSTALFSASLTCATTPRSRHPTASADRQHSAGRSHAAPL